MRVVICGAGQVGSIIARRLAAEKMHVTVIDQDVEQARRASESLDVRSIVGHAAHPEVLDRAGARDADMLIAVTRSDEVNMVACQVGYTLFNVKRRIARVRHHGYLAPLWGDLYAADQLPIDVIISPEIEVANGVMRRLKTPGAFDMVRLAEGRVQLLGIHCTSRSCSIVGHPLSELATRFPGVELVVISIIRNGKAFVPHGDDRIENGDDVYVVTTPDDVERVMIAFGHTERMARRVVIVGGGNVGLHLAQRITREAPGIVLKIVEFDRARAEAISRELESVLVLQGDALDPEVLREVDVARADTLVAVTNDDETNIFASVLARRNGCERAITLVNKTYYEALMPLLGVDAVVSPSAITISSILRHVRDRSIIGLYTLGEGFGEVFEAEAQPGSRLVAGPLRDVGMPEGMKIGALARNGQVIIPDASERVQPGDRVIAVVTYGALDAAQALLAGADTKR